ncbi:hypothetical protein [Streptomyces sp. NPDC002851]
MSDVRDLQIDEKATYGIETYTHDSAGELVNSSIGAIEGSEVRGDVKALLVMAYDTVTQDGDRIELTGRRLTGGGGTLTRTFTRIK